MTSQVYQTRRKMERETDAPARGTRTQGPDLSQLQGGAMPTSEQMGRRVDLPGAIQAKMEAAFGADLSGVELYESQTVADAGAKAMTMGNKIGFAPGELDLASSGGQALLGHELSHVVSQARGEVTGSGFLNDHALEARADREGALAAAGEAVYTGPVTPISNTSTAVSAAGPMQAKKEKKTEISEPMLISQKPVPQALYDEAQASWQSQLDAANQMKGEKKEDVAKKNAAIQAADKEFFTTAGKIVEAMPAEMLQRDKSFQKRVTEDTAQVSRRQLKELGPDSSWGEISTAAFRGSGGNISQGPFQKMLRRMVGEEALLSAYGTDDSDESIRQVTQLAQDSGAADLLEQFQESSFEGFNFKELDKSGKSRMTMQNFYTRVVGPVIANHNAVYKDRSKAAQRRIALRSGTGAFIDEANPSKVGFSSDAGREMLDLLVTREAQRDAAQKQLEESYSATSMAHYRAASPEQRAAGKEYIRDSRDLNGMLRGNADVPEAKRGELQEMAKNLSGMMQTTQSDQTGYRAISDAGLLPLLAQAGMENVIRPNGTVDHEALLRQKDRLIGLTFQDKGFVSTTAKSQFAERWGQGIGRRDLDFFKQRALERRGISEEEENDPENKGFLELLRGPYAEKMAVRDRQKIYGALADNILKGDEAIQESDIGSHMMEISLPKGSKAAYIDANTAKDGILDEKFSPRQQFEILLNQGSRFRISDVMPKQDKRGQNIPNQFRIMMELLQEEEGQPAVPAPEPESAPAPAPEPKPAPAPESVSKPVDVDDMTSKERMEYMINLLNQKR